MARLISARKSSPASELNWNGTTPALVVRLGSSGQASTNEIPLGERNEVQTPDPGNRSQCPNSPSRDAVPSQTLLRSEREDHSFLLAPPRERSCSNGPIVRNDVVEEGGASFARPLDPLSLRLEDRHDLVGRWINHQDLVANQNELVAAPLRIDGHDVRRKRMRQSLRR